MPIASHLGHPSIVHYLITEMRCIPRYYVTQNQDLHCAGGNLEVVKEVAKCTTAWYQSSGATPLHLACKGCHTETVKYLVSEMNLNSGGKYYEVGMGLCVLINQSFRVSFTVHAHWQHTTITIPHSYNFNLMHSCMKRCYLQLHNCYLIFADFGNIIAYET